MKILLSIFLVFSVVQFANAKNSSSVLCSEDMAAECGEGEAHVDIEPATPTPSGSPTSSTTCAVDNSDCS